ncbi:MAG: tetratricopeptide repeat protein [Micropepsaceae bacterium]
MLFSGVAFAAALAGAGFYLFFANVPERGAAATQVAVAAPQKIERADIDRMIQERNAFAPKPGENIRTAKVELQRAREAKGDVALTASLPETGLSQDTPLARPAGAQEAMAVSPDAMRVAEAPAAAQPAPAASEARVAVSAADAAKSDEGEVMFRNGLYPEALANWRARAEAGDRWAAYRLGVELLDGKPNVVKRDVVDGAKFMLQAAKANEARAQFEMGTLYEYGTGVPADLATASEWYRKAAERGLPQAQYNYATMLETGDGVLEDRIEALKFYTLAAEQGFASPPVDGSGRVDNNAPTAMDRLRLELQASEVRDAEERAAAFRPIED